MNIQNYILPDWKEKITSHELPVNIKEKFVIYGESMAEYLDRFMMRSLPENWYRGWTRYKFPLSTDDLVIDMHEVIAKNFGEYVNQYRDGKKDQFSISEEEIQKIQDLEKQYQEKLQNQDNEFTEIKSDISKLRKTRENRPKKVRRKPHKRTKMQKQEKIVEERQIDKSKSTEPKNLDHDFVYKKWMEMVEAKPISKSYWHIHEYMSRYILDFAKKNTTDGRITKEVIEDFLADYGKGKRPKTMNHYNRVVYRFWDFYETLSAPEADEMKVW